MILTTTNRTAVIENLIHDIEVTHNDHLTVYVPAKDVSSVTESGQPADEAEGLVFLRMEKGRTVYEVTSGTYEFSSIIN